MAIDANRDGEIKMGSSSDTTTQEKPFVFWVNDDFDKDNKEEDSGIPDWQDGLIQCTRDLEDFSRIKISVGGLREAFQQGKFKLGFEWKQTTDSPAVQIYPQVEESAGEGYLKDEAVAAAQIEPGIPTGRWAYVAGGGGTLIGTGQAKVFASLPTSIATRDFEEDGMIHLLFEGCGEGKGQLCITIHDENGAKIGDGPGVWLDLKNVKKMYQRVVATPENGFDPPYDYTTPPPEPNVGYNIYAADGNLFQTPPDEEKKAVVFVHGWNMTWNDYHSFSETMFKRLWHKGYKGRFVSFRWPTLAGGLMTHYNTSEHRGWKYGSALKAYVDSLPNDYTKNIAAHSMGNVVAGSALKSGMTITNYALMQAAIPAGCYDTSSTINNYARFLNAEASVPTPDLANPDLGYRGYLSSVSGNLVNFYNADDFALVTGSYPVIGEANWEKNQESYKPDDHPVGPGHYLYDPNAPAGQRGQVTFTLSNGRFVTDPHEMMSFVARPRSKAVGAMTGVGSPVNVGPGSSSNFGDSRSDHSGQFDRRIQELQSFYDSLYDLVR